MTMQKVKFWRPIWNKTVSGSGYPCRLLAGDTKTPDTDRKRSLSEAGHPEAGLISGISTSDGSARNSAGHWRT